MQRKALGALPRSRPGAAGLSGDSSVPAGYHTEVRYAAAVFGIHGAEKRCLKILWNEESGWNPDAVNPTSDAYGIPQALPAAHGHPYALGDWQGQIRWGWRYITGRYGDPCTALAHENAAGWY